MGYWNHARSQPGLKPVLETEKVTTRDGCDRTSMLIKLGQIRLKPALHS